jgi:Protein of unknown function (DUF3775)
MLKDLNTDQARFVALLAKAARTERDAMLGHGPSRTLNEAAATRGERNPTAALGFDPLPADNTQLKALHDALDSLSVEARSELYVLMRVGQGQVTARQWHRGLQEAQLLGATSLAAALIEDPDLHDHVLKGLFETDRAA